MSSLTDKEPIMEIKNLAIDNTLRDLVTDNPRPSFTFFIESDKLGTVLKSATISCNGFSKTIDRIEPVVYQGQPLKPYTRYEVVVTAEDNNGETDTKTATFETGKLSDSWKGKWISDDSYEFTEKRASPKPMLFRKLFALEKPVKRARIYSSAIGVYNLYLNDKKVGNRYLAPGFTSYEHYLQYQVYDVTDLLGQDNTLYAVVGGGWAVGSYVMTRVNRIFADRQALILELRVEYEDGSVEVLASDTSFDVIEDGNFRMIDIYDGETYDATVDLSKLPYRKASLEKPRIKPMLIAEYGAPVVEKERLKPVQATIKEDSIVYDFGQNFAGLTHLRIKNAKKGQTIVVKHAEILREDGHINTALLRTAKQTATYITKEGPQEYHTELSYYGFRYIEVYGIAAEDLEVEGIVCYSDIAHNGSWSCSDERLNRLQQNIVWSAKSNLYEIPTDCPQRDERMGWTGDINVFAPVATYNFELTNFLTKWLKDLRAEQLSTGGIPSTVPHKGYGFPATFPTVACDFWGDACVNVPYALYLAKNDKSFLADNYETMVKYVNACKWWAGLFSFGKRRYIWSNISFIHFGDWVAPGQSMGECQSRHKWTATASLFLTSSRLSEIAKILGKEEDAKKYKSLSEKVADAYASVLTDGNGRMLKKEFQTAYVLPIHFGMFDETTTKKAADRLAELVKENDYRIGTGFPGTPYILFALADHGHVEEAYKMLLQTKDPSWLHEVVTGGTTIWERFDGLDDDGKLNVPEDGTGGMISFNHYASGAVGDFLYRRILGLEATKPGYEEFKLEPILGGNITHCEGDVLTPFGKIEAKWALKDNKLNVNLRVPCGCKARVLFPDGTSFDAYSGTHVFEGGASHVLPRD